MATEFRGTGTAALCLTLAVIWVVICADRAYGHHGVFPVTVTGRWLCNTSAEPPCLPGMIEISTKSGTQCGTPMGDVRLELNNSNLRGTHSSDDRMATGCTNADGTFVLDGSGGDGWGGKPDPYVASLLETCRGSDRKATIALFPPSTLAASQEVLEPWVTCEDELYRVRSHVDSRHDEHSHDDLAGYTHSDITGRWSIDLGDLVYEDETKAGEPTQCEAFLAAQQVAREYVASTGTPPPYETAPPNQPVKVIWWYGAAIPRAEYIDIKWRAQFPDNTPAQRHALVIDTMRHEFGHTVRHFLDGSFHHWNGDLGGYVLGRCWNYCDPHHAAGNPDFRRLGFAFNEGWADYWADVTHGCGRCAAGQRQGFLCDFDRGDPNQNKDSCNTGGPLASTPEEFCATAQGTGTCAPDYADMTIPGNVAHGLRNLQIQCGLSRAEMISVLKNHPSGTIGGEPQSGEIHSFGDFEAAACADFPTRCCGVVDVLEQHPRISVWARANASSVYALGQIRNLEAAASRVPDAWRTAVEKTQHLPPCDSGSRAQAYLAVHGRAELLRAARTVLAEKIALRKTMLELDAELMSGGAMQKARARYETRARRAFVEMYAALEQRFERDCGSVSGAEELVRDLAAARSRFERVGDASGGRLPPLDEFTSSLLAPAPATPD